MTYPSNPALTGSSLNTNCVEAYVFGSGVGGKNLVTGATYSTSLAGSAAYGSDTLGVYLETDNANDALTITNSALTIADGDFTIAVAFTRRGDVPTWAQLFRLSAGSGSFFALFKRSSFTYSHVNYAGNDVPAADIELDGGPVPLDTEHCVVFTRSGTTGKAYMTGGSTRTWDATGTPNVGALATLVMGATAGDTAPYRWRMFWRANVALSEANAQSLANNPQQLFEAAASTPAAPSGVTSGSITPTSATCSWTDNSSDETSFDVQYSESPYSSWTTLSGSPTAANATSLATGNVLTDGTSYKFRVRATNSNGSSSWVESGVFTTTTLTRLRPNADTSNSGWSASTGSDLFATIDETVADDADYITTASTGTYKTKLQSATDPGSNLYHKVKVRARKSSGTLTVQLVQGNPTETTIASTAIAATGSFAEYTLSVAEAEAANITDYGDLYVKVIAS